MASFDFLLLFLYFSALVACHYCKDLQDEMSKIIIKLKNQPCLMLSRDLLDFDTFFHPMFDAKKVNTIRIHVNLS